MSQRTIRSIFTFFVGVVVSAIIAHAQTADSTIETRVVDMSSRWLIAQSVGSSKSKLYVVTTNQPQRRQTCHVQSFTKDKLVCSRAIGRSRTYMRQQVAALILPGDHEFKLRFVLSANAVMAAAIWGTVVLAPTCPVCAVATGIVALGSFLAAGAVLIGDEQPEKFLYLAPGQKLGGKFRFVQRLGD